MAVRGEVKLRPRLGALVLCALISGLSLPVNAIPPGDRNNGYIIEVGGFYHGKGTATLQGKMIDLTATIQTDDGGAGTLDVKHLKVRNNHFVGQGTICGHTATFEGRVDDVPGRVPPGHAVLGRITVTFSVDDGHTGRIVGFQG